MSKQTEQLEQPIPISDESPPTNNNNQICDKTIAKFNCLKEAYSIFYKYNQSLIRENERWKIAVEGFNNS
ncbi:995_t:CDS:1, partial [Racocetra persica]